MLALAVAPLWHHHAPLPGPTDHAGRLAHHEGGHGCNADRPHHDHDSAPASPTRPAHPGNDGHDCPICIAIHTPIGTGLAGPTPRLALDHHAIGFVPTLSAQRPTVRFLPVLWPCGPPSHTA